MPYKIAIANYPHPDIVIHDDLTKLEIVRISRLARFPESEVTKNPAFKHRPVGVTYADIVGLIERIRPNVVSEDRSQALMSRHYTREMKGYLQRHPAALAAEVRRSLTPMRIDFLDWYVHKLLHNEQVSAIERHIAVDMDLLDLIRHYTRAVTSQPPFYPLSPAMVARLTPEQQTAIIKVIHLRSMLVKRSTVMGFMPHDLDDNTKAAVQTYLADVSRRLNNKLQKEKTKLEDEQQQKEEARKLAALESEKRAKARTGRTGKTGRGKVTSTDAHTRVKPLADTLNEMTQQGVEERQLHSKRMAASLKEWAKTVDDTIKGKP